MWLDDVESAKAATAAELTAASGAAAGMGGSVADTAGEAGGAVLPQRGAYEARPLTTLNPKS